MASVLPFNPNWGAANANNVMLTTAGLAAWNASLGLGVGLVLQQVMLHRDRFDGHDR